MSINKEGEPTAKRSTLKEIERQIHELDRDPAGHVIDKVKREALFQQRTLELTRNELPNL